MIWFHKPIIPCMSTAISAKERGEWLGERETRVKIVKREEESITSLSHHPPNEDYFPALSPRTAASLQSPSDSLSSPFLPPPLLIKHSHSGGDRRSVSPVGPFWNADCVCALCTATATATVAECKGKDWKREGEKEKRKEGSSD